MKPFQQHIMFPQEVKAVTINIVGLSMVYDTENRGLQFKYLIHEVYWKNVKIKIQKLWGWFTTVGIFVSGFTGTYILDSERYDERVGFTIMYFLFFFIFCIRRHILGQ